MKVFFTLLIFLTYVLTNAQVNNQYESLGLSNAIEILEMAPQDNASLRRAELRSRKKGRPDCFAKSLKTNIDPHQNGTWDYTRNDIAVWRLKIISKSAKTLNLGFAKYFMPEGGNLYLLGKAENQILGPFTPADNEEHGQLWTPVVKGDEITIEIQIPSNKIDQLNILLEHVNHDFIDILKSGSNSRSGSCNVDVICGADDGLPIIDTKRDIINSVGAYTLNGIEQCSGVLINTARNDCTPYFLTANHCEVSNSNAASVVVYWNYENSVCRQPETVESGRDGDGTFAQFTTGSSFISGYAPSDFTLLLLDDEVSAEFTPYFAGWNVGRELPDSSVCVHHPNIEEKRISFDFDPNVISIDAAADSFVRVESWDLGTTERGSSGAPLFNNNDEIIGVLNSGQATCNNSQFDDFGPMFLSWEGGGTPETRLKDWLDPDGIGLVSLSGKNCTITLRLEESVVEVCGENTDTQIINFTVNENFDDEVSLSINNPPSGLNIEFDEVNLAPGANSKLTLSNINNLDPDIYQIELVADDGANVAVSSLVLKVFSSSGESVIPIQPSDGSSGELTNTFIRWTTDSEEVDFELSTDSQFSNIVIAQRSLTESFTNARDLLPGTKYYWRLRAKNICGVGDWSVASSFTTGQVFCSGELLNTETIEIPDSQSDTIISPINVTLNGLVRNVQITNIEGQHTWVGDLSMNLISPNGSVVNLIDFICDDADDFSLGFSDDQGADDIPCPITDQRLYQPNGKLSSLNGELAAGVWQLQIIDIATLDGGRLNQWGLEICTEISTEAIIYLGNDDINTCGVSTTDISVGLGLGFDGEVSMSLDFPDEVNARLETTSIENGGATKLSISDLEDTPVGTYQIEITAADGNKSISETINLVVSKPIEILSLSKPTNGAINTPYGPFLEWERNGSEESYFLQLSTTSDFASIVYDTILDVNSIQVVEGVLMGDTEYFWRVAASNGCGSVLSDTYSFKTEFVDATFQLGDVTFDIYPNPASSKISLTSTNPLDSDLDLKIYNISGQIVLTDQLRKGIRDFSVNIDDLQSGLYFLKLESGNSNHTEKIVIHN